MAATSQCLDLPDKRLSLEPLRSVKQNVSVKEIRHTNGATCTRLSSSNSKERKRLSRQRLKGKRRIRRHHSHMPSLQRNQQQRD